MTENFSFIYLMTYILSFVMFSTSLVYTAIEIRQERITTERRRLLHELNTRWAYFAIFFIYLIFLFFIPILLQTPTKA
jgi:hypothetical protein